MSQVTQGGDENRKTFEPVFKAETITFPSLPQNLGELKGMEGADLADPFYTAALTVAVLCRYGDSPKDTEEMLDYLKGPRPLNPYDKQFLKDRLGYNNDYIPYSFFNGTSPQGNYVPQKYELTLTTNDYSYDWEGYCKLYIRSSGADSARQIVLRTAQGKWYLWEQHLLSGIRTPAALDPWT